MVFWRQPSTSFFQISVLLSSNAILLAFARFAVLGVFDFYYDIILAIFEMFLFYIASLVSLLIRSDSDDIQSDAKKLAKLMVVVWLVSLVLFLPNAIPGLIWFDKFPSYFISFFHSFIAVALIVKYSRSQMRKKDIASVDMKKEIYSGYKCALFVLIINSIFFEIFILNYKTQDWIRENYLGFLEVFR